MTVESTSATTPAVTKAAKRDDHTKANDGSEETTKVNLPRCASIPREREALKKEKRDRILQHHQEDLSQKIFNGAKLLPRDDATLTLLPRLRWDHRREAQRKDYTFSFLLNVESRRPALFPAAADIFPLCRLPSCRLGRRTNASDAGTGGPGGHWSPQFLADQLTLLQPGRRADHPHLLLLPPPLHIFFTFRHHWMP